MRDERLLREFIESALNEAEGEGEAGRPRSQETPFSRAIDKMGGTKAFHDKTGISISHTNRLARRVGYPSIKTLKKIMSATHQTMGTVLGWFNRNKGN